jgi:hypothetical protein
MLGMQDITSTNPFVTEQETIVFRVNDIVPSNIGFTARVDIWVNICSVLTYQPVYGFLLDLSSLHMLKLQTGCSGRNVLPDMWYSALN